MMFSEDPREAIIKYRLKTIRYVIPVMSYKGGVGKTIVSSLLALSLSDLGYRVGLLDLDFTNPSLHRVLGVDPTATKPREEKGVVPPEVDRVSFMSLAYYIGENPAPFRGKELYEIYREIFSITIWGEKDFLVIDHPPGLSDISLDTINLIGKYSRPLIVSSVSKLAITPTINLVNLLREVGVDPLGVVINMYRDDSEISREVEESFRRSGVELLGRIRYDLSVERFIGSLNNLRSSLVYRDVREVIINEVLKRLGI